MMTHKIDKCRGCLHENESIECESCKACKIELWTGNMTKFEHNPETCKTCAKYLHTPICSKCKAYDRFLPKMEESIAPDMEQQIKELKSSNAQRKYIIKRLDEVFDEIIRANKIHGTDFNSSNEAAGVVREEYLELEHELFHGDPDRARAEAIQLAAVAVKTIIYMDGKLGRRRVYHE